MKIVALKKDGKIFIEHCRIASSFFSRFKGLMGTTRLPETEAICFPFCNSIHTLFMRIPIDVLFLSKTGEVLEILESLPPWRLPLPRLKAQYTIEFRSGLARTLGIRVGDQIHCEGIWNEV